MNRYPKGLIVFAILMTLTAVFVALVSAESDPQALLLPILLSWLAALGAFVMAIRSVIRMVKERRWRAGRMVLATVLALGTPVLAHQMVWHSLHPRNLRYEFRRGQSGSWHEVQFHHRKDGRWIEGPWIGGWALAVSFPDLDWDGHRDLRATGARGRVAEYVFLPKAEGDRHWHLVRNEGYYVSYPPDGHYYP